MSDSAAPSAETSRRRLLAWLGAGGAAALATLFSRDAARAGHDGTNTFHLGGANDAGGTATRLRADVDDFALNVLNANHGLQAGGLAGESHGGSLPGVQGTAWDDSFAGVYGVSSAGDPVSGFGGGYRSGVEGRSGSGYGVNGMADAGIGVRGHSQSGAGVRGESADGTGGEFDSESGYALRANGQTHLGGIVDNFVLGVDNERTSEEAGGILAISRGGKPAVEGDAIPNESHGGIGVQGVSGYHETFGQGPGIGVQGISGTGVGVDAISEEGLALRVQGRAAFSTVGSAAVPPGASSVFVPNGAVTEESHVAVTLAGAPGRRAVRWVERAPGAGFTVYLSGASPRDPELPLTYSIVEPA